MPQPSPERSSLLDLARQNLRRHFLHSVIVRQLDSKLIPAPPVATRCRERACPFPIYDQERGLCRGHWIDAHAEASTLPSALGTMIVPMHQPTHQAQAR
jgi:hypothetical protein